MNCNEECAFNEKKKKKKKKKKEQKKLLEQKEGEKKVNHWLLKIN